MTTSEDEQPPQSSPSREGLTVDAMVGEGRRVSAYRSLLRNHSYRTWFGTAFFAGIADWTGLFALQVLVVTLTDPGSRLRLFALGGIMMARLLPSLVLGPVAGVLADRYDRKRLMVVTNLVRGVIYVAVATSDSIITLFALVLIVESLSLLYLSSKDASLPVIVRRDHLTQANQLNLLVTYGTLPLGAVMATAMIPAAGALRAVGWTTVTPPVVALLFTALAFTIAGLLLTRIVLPAHGRKAAALSDTGILEELREGLLFIGNLPLIRALILGVVGVFFSAGVFITLGPAFVQTSLGGAGADWFTMMAIVGVGLVAGLLVVPLLLRFVRKEKLFPVTLALTAATALVMATLQTFTAGLAFGAALGMFAGMSFVLGYTLLHEHTDDEVRARTFATFYTVTRIALFASLGLTPFVAGVMGRGTIILGNWQFTMSGIRLTMLAAGVIALFSAWTAGRRMYSAVRTQEDMPAVRLGERVVSPARSGLFIVFEGVEGSGKSTQIERLADALRDEGHDVVATREPGGAPIAERVRGVLLDPVGAGMDARTEALLYASARAEHVQQVILPALEAGRIVLCDRFIHSSLAYQGYARGLGIAEVFEINRWAIGGLLPDVVILLYLEPEEGLRRAAARAREQGARRAAARTGEAARHLRPAGIADDAVGDRMERETVDFHREVARGFLKLAKRDRRRFRIVDGTADADTVARQVRLELHNWLPLPNADRRSSRPGKPEAAG